MLNREDDKSTAVVIGNPRSADFEVCVLHHLLLCLSYSTMLLSWLCCGQNFRSFDSHLVRFIALGSV